VHAKAKQLWKGVGVGEEESTKNYIKLVLALQMGQGIMPNTVGGQEISFLKLYGDSVIRYRGNSVILRQKDNPQKLLSSFDQFKTQRPAEAGVCCRKPDPVEEAISWLLHVLCAHVCVCGMDVLVYTRHTAATVLR